MAEFQCVQLEFQTTKGRTLCARPFSRVRSSAPQPVPHYQPMPCACCAQAWISRIV